MRSKVYFVDGKFLEEEYCAREFYRNPKDFPYATEIYKFKNFQDSMESLSLLSTIVERLKDNNKLYIMEDFKTDVAVVFKTKDSLTKVKKNISIYNKDVMKLTSVLTILFNYERR